MTPTTRLRRIIIAGSRGTRSPIVARVLDEEFGLLGYLPDVVISGAEPTGVDADGVEWAKANGITVEPYPADWDTYGRPAGPIRNSEMLRQSPDALFAFRRLGGRSPGTDDIIRKAKKAGIPICFEQLRADDEQRQRNNGLTIHKNRWVLPKGL